jgi:hypothetical protein
VVNCGHCWVIALFGGCSVGRLHYWTVALLGDCSIWWMLFWLVAYLVELLCCVLSLLRGWLLCCVVAVLVVALGAVFRIRIRSLRIQIQPKTSMRIRIQSANRM